MSYLLSSFSSFIFVVKLEENFPFPSGLGGRVRLAMGEGVQGKVEKVGREICLKKENRKCPPLGGHCGF